MRGLPRPGGDHTKRVKKGETRPPVIRFGRDSAAPVAVQNGMCLGCHEKSMASELARRPARRDQRLLRVLPRQPRAQGRGALAAHAGRRLLHLPRRRRAGQFQKPYAHPVRQGKLACSDCHAPHGSTADKQLVKATLNQTCYECHAEKRGPFLWEHAPVAEDCSICHAPHGASNPGMLTARGPVLCQSCHSQQGHPSYRLRSVGPAGRRRAADHRAGARQLHELPLAGARIEPSLGRDADAMNATCRRPAARTR